MSIDLTKPNIGEPCNGCGICCRITICMHGTYWLGFGQYGDKAPGPCPASILQDNRFQCGLVLFPKKYIKLPLPAEKIREAMKVLIGSGRGCDSVGYYATPEMDKELDDLNAKTINEPGQLLKLQAAIKLIYNI